MFKLWKKNVTMLEEFYKFLQSWICKNYISESNQLYSYCVVTWFLYMFYVAVIECPLAVKNGNLQFTWVLYTSYVAVIECPLVVKNGSS